MFLSFLKSMQNKSQDAQNPGLWVNGNRMPTNLNEMFPPGQRRDDAETNSPMPGSQAETDNNKRKADAELAAKIAANKEAQDAKKDDDDDKNDTADNDVFVGKGKTDPRFVKKELKNANRPMLIGPNYHENGRRFADNSKALGTNSSGVRGDDHSYISKKKQEEMDASTDPAVLERVRLRKERKARIAARKKGAQSSFEPDYLSDHRNRTNLDVDGNDPTPEKEELTWQQQEKQSEERLGALKQKGKLGKLLKENTNRSMFLTHLQGMQNKSQEAQNPGLWVNGNRMPMHENTPGGGTPAGASPEEFAKARAANPFRVRLGKGRPAGAQDLNGDGLVSKAEQELIPVDLRDGDPSANHPDDTDYVHGDN